jgi:CHAT domain-containing protein/tetratricopeptide (TPR) repeat protein
MTEPASRHPEIATMAAFVEGRLPPHELATVAGHLRDCAECRLLVTETARFEREEEARRPRATWRWIVAAAAAVAAAAITVPLLNRGDEPIEQLIAEAPRQHRRVDARLSGFPWAELRPPSRGVESSDPADLKLAGAAGAVLERTEGDASADARHAAGVAYLLTDQRSRSVAALEEAARTSKDARVWNDLAAARLALVARDAQPSQLPLALAAVDRALVLDPQSAEARFNRALILERLGHRQEARKAWQAFLAIDGTSGWSVEARAHLKRLDGGGARFEPKAIESEPPAELVRRFPQEARTRAEGVLLAEWADALVGGDEARANARLARARAIGEALAARSGEQLLRDAVAAIDRANAASQGLLAEAHRTYRDGRIAFSKRRDAEAVRLLRAAGEQFRRGGSPMADLAATFAASASMNVEPGEAVRGQLLALQQAIDARRYRALDAEVRWALTVLANMAGDWGSAIREGAASAKTFHDLGERSNAANVDSVVAYALEVIGEKEQAWARRLRVIEGLCGGADNERCNHALRNAAFTLTTAGRAEGGAALMDVSIADSADAQPAFLARALSDRARAAGLMADASAAARAITDARRAAARIADPGARAVEETQIAVADAVTRGAEAKAFDRAAAFYRERNMPRPLVDVLLQRARAHRRERREEAALADYGAALREIESQQSSIGDPSLRLTFLDTAAQVFEESIELRVERGEIEAAFDVASRRHGASATARRIPRGVAAIEYAVLPRKLVLFLASHDGVSAETIAIARDELAARVDAFAAQLRGRGKVEKQAAELYALLIAPLRARLEGVEELVIVPDQQLHALPFGALYDPSRSRYLIEDFAIRFAPAASVAGRDAVGPLSPALVVADPPAADRPRLELSREEALRIASMHQATLLSGDGATRERFVAAAAESALIHYAGHADSDPATSFGALLLAGSGILDSTAIRHLSLPLEPLVVLGACGTARGDTRHVAGMASIARAFLTAGARGVVGTLWEVDDDVAAALFSRFHQNLRAGASPARALRDAQVDMLRSGEPRLEAAGSWAVAELLSHS